MNTPPAPGEFFLVGSAEWVATGGVDNSGHIMLINNTGQSSAVLFPDFDEGLVVAAFEFECMIKVGDWYGNPPADGFSVNYADADDPIIAVIEGGQDPGRGDTAATANGINGWAGSQDNLGTENNLPEEGTKTGIGIGFDTWGTGTAPVGGSNGELDVRGISVRVDGVQIAQIAMPDVLFDDDYDFLGDPTTLITGPFTFPPQAGQNQNFGDPTQGAPPAPGTRLGWAPLRVTVNEAGLLNVWWKGENILQDYDSGFSPRPGRILFGASTGGAMQYTGIDNIKITTFPASTLIIASAIGNPIGFRVQIIDSGPAVSDPDAITLNLNGVDVPVTSVSKDGINTFASFADATQPLPPGSIHTVVVTATDTNGETEEQELTFTVPDYLSLPPEFAVAAVDTAQTGFFFKVHQTNDRGQANTIARAEQQLQEMRGANVAWLEDYPYGPEGQTFVGNVIAEPGVINYSQNQADEELLIEPAGFFQAPEYPDAHIPGIPSFDVFADPANTQFYTDNIAAEIITYVHFPVPGAYEVIFNSDDGFRTTAASSAHEVLNSMIIGEFDGGRGATDTVSTLYIAEAGYYPMRSVWFEGDGGANLEWSARRTAPNSTPRLLINDPDPSSIKAFRAPATPGPAAVTFTHPFRGSGNPYLPTTTLIAKIQDGAAVVDPASIRMLLNDAELDRTLSKAGNITTVTHTPAGFLPGGTHELKITFTAGDQEYEGATTFTIADLVVPPSLALPASEVNTANAGFLVKTVQNASYADLGTRANNTYGAESQINSLLGLPNTANLAGFTGPSGRYVETGFIDYYSTGDVGFFGNDLPVPGIPGINPVGTGDFPPSTGFPDEGTDNYSQEILTVLDLQAGYYTMNVTSDDGFRLTIGNPNEWSTLPRQVGVFDGGRGAGTAFGSGTTFHFYIQEAGLYPFRLLWYEGGGGSSVEWSSRTPTVDPITGHINANAAVLINDTATAGHISAYQYPLTSAGVPYVKSFSPGRSDRTSAASQARAGSDAVIRAVIDEGVGTVTEAGVSLTVNGEVVTPTVTKAGSEVTVTYAPDAPWADGVHSVALTFAGRTVNWSFRTTSAWKTPAFFIEAEDFDSDGAGQAEASQMPYAGGAYAGLNAVAGTDYERPDNAPSPLYRHGVNPRVSMDRTGDRDRGIVDIKVNYKIGWTGPGHWYNYTRDLPTGTYNIFAALSHGDGPANATALRGSLQQVNGAEVTELGVFSAPGTGGWGNNALVPLRDAPDGTVQAVDLGGQTTLRFTTDSGDWDFMLLMPAVDIVDLPEITGVEFDSASNTITVQWTGGGALEAATSLDGPWDTVATESPAILPFDPEATAVFGRIRR